MNSRKTRLILAVAVAAALFGYRALHVLGKHAPGVGFDFEMPAGARISPVPRQSLRRVVAGGAQRRGGFGIERDVEMDPRLVESVGIEASGIHVG